MTNVWHHWPGIDEEVAAIFDPFGNAVHTALAFPVLGEDVLVVGAGPDRADGHGRRAPCRRPPHRRQRAERLPPRARRRAMGATLAVDPRERDLDDVQRELGMVEGFDVVLEMSGNAGRRCATPSRTWPTAPGWPSSASRPRRSRSTSAASSSTSCRLRGIYGREMYETWYKMSVMLQSGLDIAPAITHRFGYRDHEAAFAAARTGDSGKVVMDWTVPDHATIRVR